MTKKLKSEKSGRKTSFEKMVIDSVLRELFTKEWITHIHAGKVANCSVVYVSQKFKEFEEEYRKYQIK